MKFLSMIFIFCYTLTTNTFGQKPLRKPHHTRVSRDTTYIPIDLEDCLVQIDKIFADSIKAKIKQMRQDEFSSKMHFGLGMWMRNNWGLWKGSRLSKFFNSKGIFHPDDMSGIILKSYYRHLKGQEINLDEQVKFYQAYWNKMNEEELKQKQIQFAKYQIGDTVLFNYRGHYVSKAQEEKFDKDICTAKGVIIAKDQQYYFIKVKLIDACDRKGIISYDNEGSLVYNKVTGKFEKPKSHIVSYMKKGEENWFNFNSWINND